MSHPDTEHADSMDAEDGHGAHGGHGGHGHGYGAMPPPPENKGIFLRSKRRTMNVYAVLLGLFIPWLIYLVVCSALSFKLRYSQPFLAYGIVFAMFLLVVAFGVLACRALRHKLTNKSFVDTPTYEPTWYMFIFLTSLLAFLAGAWMGNRIFNDYTLACYTSSSMTVYSNVNPEMMSGAQLMDAGVVNFAPGTAIDTTRWMSFKDRSVYCVAPISKPPGVLSSYDFWAVGVDCCAQTWTSGATGSRAYHCGDFNKKNASTGLRLMNDDQRAFFRLGVQQAEAAYKIRAVHPLFFHWKDTSGDTAGVDANADASASTGLGGGCSGSGGFSKQYNEGQQFFRRGIFTEFVLQFWLVAIACIAFSRLGYY